MVVTTRLTDFNWKWRWFINCSKEQQLAWHSSYQHWEVFWWGLASDQPRAARTVWNVRLWLWLSLQAHRWIDVTLGYPVDLCRKLMSILELYAWFQISLSQVLVKIATSVYLLSLPIIDYTEHILWSQTLVLHKVSTTVHLETGGRPLVCEPCCTKCMYLHQLLNRLSL